MSIFALGGLLIAVYLLSIVLHEWGHARALSVMTKKRTQLRISWKGIVLGCKKDYQLLNEEQYRSVMWAGIVVGLFSLFVMTALLLPGGFGMFLIIGSLHLWGCRKDITNILHSHQRERRTT